MAKDKLENILSFKDFSELPKYDKSTKRTEVGGDVLNENIYDKVKDAILFDREYEQYLDKFKSYILGSCKGGHVSNIDIDGNIATFDILKREYKLDKSKSMLYLYAQKYEKYKDERKKTKSRVAGKEEVSLKIPKKMTEEIFTALEKC